VFRLFNVYYPKRFVFLLMGEALLLCASFFLALALRVGRDDFSLVLYYENGYFKIFGITLLALLGLYYMDLYDYQRLRSREETYFRLLLFLGAFSFLLAGLDYFFSSLFFSDLISANGVLLLGLVFSSISLVSWRSAYGWMLTKPFLRERVFVLGTGPQATTLVETLRSRTELGMEVLGWAGEIGEGSLTRTALAHNLAAAGESGRLDRVIVALSNRRGTLPLDELLDLRLRGVKVEDAASLLERISGKIEIDGLNPSWLIFNDGFRLNSPMLLIRRVHSLAWSLLLLLLSLPVIPLVVLAIKLDSAGGVLYRQKRVGRLGKVFYCYKFRTMRHDAEADTGPTWAGDDDPRITRVGRFLRSTRLDEIPQLWNVLRGDMAFVGPRPERPEFVEWLSKEIPFYLLRHVIRPGITGWAQVCYQYGSSVEEAKEKLRYDLYYIKHISVALDLFVVFQTVKIALFGRGAK
jgi:sugar transferase (PEP-CTERM system associated)